MASISSTFLRPLAVSGLLLSSLRPPLTHAQTAAPVVVATQAASLAIDVDGDGRADPGDTLRYAVTVSNTGSVDALGVRLDETLDPNTQLAGTVRATPLARADAYTATQATPLSITAADGLLNNDFGLPAPTALARTTPTAQGGTVTVATDGALVYTSAAGFVGTDTFTYTARNGQGTDVGTVAVNVFALPQARPDAYATLLNTPVTVTAASGLLVNDELNGATLTAYAAISAEGGSVTANADGSFIYTPATGFFSPPVDTFTYTVANAVATSTATVSITVDLPGPPVAAADVYTATANTPLNVPAAGVLANDTLSGATISAYAANTAEGGSVTLSPNGAFVYTPPVDFISPPTDTFTYTLRNALGTSTATVQVTVRPAAAPSVVSDVYTATANLPLVVTAVNGVLSNDTAHFGGVVAHAPTSARGGSVSVGPDGGFSYVPPADTVSPPTDTFTYTVANALGADTGTVTVTINPPAAPDAVGDGYTTTVNTPLTVTVASGLLANDTRNFATLSLSPTVTALGGAVSVSADGSFVYTPPTDTVSPPTDTFTYTLSNALGSDSATVRITLDPAAAPVAAGDTYTTTANVTLTVAAGAGLLVNDQRNFATISDFSAVSARGGAVDVGADGGFLYVPPADTVSPPTDTFTYTLRNALGASTATVTVTVAPPAAPVAADDSFAATANTPLTVTAASGVFANDTRHFATLTAAATATARGGSVTLNADGSFVYTPPADTISPPTDTFTYTLGNLLGTSTATVRITLNPPGAPLAAGDTYTATRNVSRVVAAPGVLVNDTGNFAQIESYGAASAQGGSVALAPNGGFTYDPPLNFLGTDTFTYTLANALGTSTATVSMTVQPLAPEASDDSFATIGNVAITVTAVSGVLANDTLHTAVLTAWSPAGSQGGELTLNADGSFAYNPVAGFTGTDTFTYTIANATGSDTATVSVAVSQRVWFVNNQAPAGGDGRHTEPFDTLAEAAAASSTSDVIYVYAGDGTTTGQNAGITLKANQRLIGQHVALVVNATTIEPAVPGSHPRIGNPGGNAVTVPNVSGVEVRGVALSAGVNGVDVTTSGSLSATFSLRDSLITAAGAEGIDINQGSTGTLSLELSNLTINGGSPGLDVSRTAGQAVVTGFANNSFSGALVGAGAVFSNVIFDSVSGGTFNTVSGGDLAIGASTNGVGTTALSLSNVSGDLSFTSLLAATEVGAALNLSGAGVYTGASGFRLSVASGQGTLLAAGGPALTASSATLDLQAARLVSTNSTTNGVRLNGVAGTLSADLASTLTQPAGIAFDVVGGSGDVDFNGSISTGGGRSVSIANRTAGQLTFDGAITDTHAGISLSNNTGATILFRGGLTLNTGSATAFSATGGGVVGVSSITNTIQTTSGQALLVTDTSIHTGGLTFRSISSNGAANAIRLANTGSLGGLSITGNGSANSGGLIQNTTGTALVFTNTRDINLAYLRLENSGDDGINAATVTNFALSNSVVSDTSGSATAEGLELDNVTGVITLSTVTVSGAPHNNVWIDNSSGTLTSLSVSNSTFQDTSASPFGAHGFLLTLRGTAGLTAAAFNTVTFSGNAGAGLMVSAEDTAGVAGLAIDASTFSNNDTALNLAQANGASLTFQLTNNTLTGSQLHAVNIFSSPTATSGLLAGRVTGNIIGVTGSAGSGSVTGSGIRAVIQAQTDGRLLIGNNTIRQTPLGRGIEVTGGSDSLDVTVTGNDVNPQDTSGLPLAAILLLSDNTTGSQNGVLRADVTGNTVPAASNTYDYPGFAGTGTYLRLQEESGTTLELVGAGSPDATSRLTASNTGSASASAGVALISGPIVLPPQRAADGVGPGAEAVSAAQLAGVHAAAVAQWAAAGEIGSLAGSRIVVTDLDGDLLAEADGEHNTIYIDADAAGWGWFIDATPDGDDEYSDGRARPEGPAQGRMDALSVLVHEMGHLLGRAHAPGGVMAERLAVGTRLLDLAGPPERINAGSVSVAIGMLPAGRTVTVVFEVVVAPIVPAGVGQVSNQGTLSGANFSTVVTDDPATATIGDPTRTVLDVRTVLHLPGIWRDFVARPDLTVSVSLSPNKTAFSAGEPVLLTVVVGNTGLAPAVDFWVDAYLNPSTPPTAANQLWNDRCGLQPCYGMAWHVTEPLAPGASLTLTSAPTSTFADNTRWPGGFAAGTTDVYVYVDSYSDDGGSAGQVREQDEANNRAEIRGLTVLGPNRPGTADDLPQAFPGR